MKTVLSNTYCEMTELVTSHRLCMKYVARQLDQNQPIIGRELEHDLFGREKSEV